MELIIVTRRLYRAGYKAGTEPSRVGTQDNFTHAVLSTGEDRPLQVASSTSSLAPTGHQHLLQETLPPGTPLMGISKSQKPTFWALLVSGGGVHVDTPVLGVPSEQDNISSFSSPPGPLLG